MLPSMPTLSPAPHRMGEICSEALPLQEHCAENSAEIVENQTESKEDQDSIRETEKRKLLSLQQPRKKRKSESLHDSEEASNESASHLAEAYFAKAKSLLDDETLQKFITVLAEAVEEPGAAVKLYREMEVILKDHKELLDDFVGFLLPHQAKECGKLMEHNFFEKAWTFFKSMDATHVNKVFNALEHQSPNGPINSDNLKQNILPLLKGQPNLSKAFLNLLPDEKPPPCSKESFEEVNDVTSMEYCDEWERVTIQEHPTRCLGNDCGCRCHLKSSQFFCTACNIKFSNGQIYVQHGKVLRFARVSFGDIPQTEMLEKLHPALYSRRSKTKKAKEHRASHKESQNLLKDNQIELKDHEIQNERLSLSSPEKCDRTEEEDDWEDGASSCDKWSTCDPFEISFEDQDTSDSFRFHSPFTERLSDFVESPIMIDDEKNEETKQDIEIKEEIPSQSEPEPIEIKTEIKTEQDEPSTSKENLESKTLPEDDSIKKDDKKLWTRDEDKMILQAFQKEICSEQTFSKISGLMPARTVQDIQQRFQLLMNLLEKVASGAHDVYPS